MYWNTKKPLQLALLCCASASMLSAGSAAAQPSIMVAGDSISAGFGRPSYRLPLLNALSDYDCPVSMVGSQTLNDFNYREAVDDTNGSHFPGFSPADGFDTDHQAFPGITTDQFAFGVSSVHFTIDPITTYVSPTQPDFVLLHLGSNDMGGEFVVDRLNSDDEIQAWANTTVDDMQDVINGIISVHDQPDTLRILVANFIPYAAESRTPAQLVRAKRASELYTNRLESMVLDRADTNVLIVDVETGFDPDTMTYDGLHPNEVGEEHLAGAFLPVLRGAGLCPNTPTVTAPELGSTVNGDTTVIRWNNNGLAVSAWRLRIGDSQSGGSSTYFDSGNLAAGARSVSALGLPADQSNLFVSLQYTHAGGTDEVLSSFISRSGTQSGVPAMRAPLPGSLLSGSSVNFTWESDDLTVRQWWVRVGSTPGGVEYFDSGRITDKSTRSVSVSGLPTNGRTVYLELSARPSVDPWVVQTFAFRSAGSGLPDKVLEPNEWYQISLPYDPGSNNRVRDIFGDALPVASYGFNTSEDPWIVTAYELDATSQLADSYRILTLNDRLEVGKGYWLLHQLSGPVTLSAPSGAAENSSNVTGAQRAACENPGRCYALPVSTAVTDGEERRLSMLGYPFANPTSALRLRVGTRNNVRCSGNRDCSLAEAERNDLATDHVFVWRSDMGAQGSYDVIGPIKGLLNPWDGFWVSVRGAANARDANLILSEPVNGR